MTARERKIKQYARLIELFEEARRVVRGRESVGLCGALMDACSRLGPDTYQHAYVVATRVVRDSIFPHAWYEGWLRANGKDTEGMQMKRLAWLGALIEQARAERAALKPARKNRRRGSSPEG